MEVKVVDERVGYSIRIVVYRDVRTDEWFMGIDRIVITGPCAGLGCMVWNMTPVTTCCGNGGGAAV